MLLQFFSLLRILQLPFCFFILLKKSFMYFLLVVGIKIDVTRWMENFTKTTIKSLVSNWPSLFWTLCSFLKVSDANKSNSFFCARVRLMHVCQVVVVFKSSKCTKYIYVETGCILYVSCFHNYRSWIKTKKNVILEPAGGLLWSFSISE